MIDLKGKVALVTGVSRGMGRADCLALARAGADVVVTDILIESDPELEKTAEASQSALSQAMASQKAVYSEKTSSEIREMGRRSIAVKMDVTNREQVKAVVDQVVSEFGSLDILVNNAGTLDHMGTVDNQVDALWDRDLKVNLTGAFNCSKAVWPHMKQRNWGRIIMMSSIAGLLDVSTADFVTTIRMNRPPVNALIAELQEQLIEALNRVKDDDATRVVLLTSAIDRYFMAGADIKSMGGEGGFDRENPATLERVAQMSRRSQAAFAEIEHFPKPLIAAINGHALGGGCELALACDYRLMIDDGRSTIGQTEASLGLIPGAGGTQRLPRLVGRARATEMIFESIRLKAPEAAAIGLINAALPADGFHEAVLERAKRLAHAAPIALRLAKEALLAGLERSPGKGYEVEAENFGKAAMTEDAMVGVMSFVSKQQSEFNGK